MGITMKELAALAQVSRTTVSLVLSGKTNGHISAENQRRVLALAAEHNFRPNAAARGLRTGKRYTIGIMLPAPHTLFYADMVTQFQAQLDRRGYTAVFSFWGHGENQNVGASLGTLRSLGVGGIISWEFDEILLAEKIPTVLYAHRILTPAVDHVMIDFENEVESALAHLTGLGHRRFGLIGNILDIRSLILRRKLAERGVPVGDGWFVSHAVESACPLGEKIERLIARKDAPTALLFPDDMIAAQCSFELRSRGRRIPEDFALLCFNDSKMLKIQTPQVSAFNLREERIAGALIDALLRRIDGADDEAKINVIEPELIIRPSTGI